MVVTVHVDTLYAALKTNIFKLLKKRLNEI